MARIDQFIFNAIAHARNRIYVVVYDISEDAERNRVSDLLIAYGIRVQYSVFECKLTKRRYTEMLAALDEAGIKTGFIKIYRTDANTKAMVIGTKRDDDIDQEDACIII